MSKHNVVQLSGRDTIRDELTIEERGLRARGFAKRLPFLPTFRRLRSLHIRGTRGLYETER